MDTGGLAQMTYNNSYAATGGLGAAGPGFATRGKGGGLKRLSVASPPSIAPISENGVETNHTPRTSRSHLLAGLRTQPKTPGHPASAPFDQTQHRFGLDASKYAGQSNNAHPNIPHTAIGASFPTQAQHYSMSAGQQVYSLPEQILAPPTIDYNSLQGEDIDPDYVNQLLQQELYLAQRRQQLEQQLLQLRLQGMNLNSAGLRQNSLPQTPLTPQNSFYQQQLQQGVSPVVQEVPGQPGLYIVYNPLTGQTQTMIDPAVQQQAQMAAAGQPATPSSYNRGPFVPDTPTFRAEISPPADPRAGNPFDNRSISPPKKTPSPPTDVTPLPPPSANAFRRGHHKKISSLSFNTNNEVNAAVSEGPKSAFTRPVGFPATPQTGTFGPGNARAGEHPIRQPRGPPPFEELLAAPTQKHENSKNFVSRQRRSAVHSLVKAGIERRGIGRQNSTDSCSAVTSPSSEVEVVFGVPSDGDDRSIRSGSASLSGKASFSSLRASANAAIGSEMKRERERKASGDSTSGDEFSKEALLDRRVRSPIGMLAGAGVKRVGGVY